VNPDPYSGPQALKAANGPVQRLDAEVGLQRVGDAPGQNLSGEPVHDRHEAKEARQIGDISAPDLAEAVHAQTGIGLVAPFSACWCWASGRSAPDESDA